MLLTKEYLGLLNYTRLGRTLTLLSSCFLALSWPAGCNIGNTNLISVTKQMQVKAKKSVAV